MFVGRKMYFKLILFLCLNYFYSASSQTTPVTTDIVSSVDNGECDSDFRTEEEFQEENELENYNYETNITMSPTMANIVAIEFLDGKNATKFLQPLNTSCKNTNCVRKCCLAGMFNYRNCQALEAGMEDWVPKISNYSLLYGKPSEICYRHNASLVELFPNGSVFFNIMNVVLSTDKYCIEQGAKDSEEDDAVLCYEVIVRTELQSSILFAGKITAGISSCFLFALIVIHVLRPKLRDKIHGKCFFSMCIALFFGNLPLLIIQLQLVKMISHVVCVMLAVLIQYFHLSFNFWLNMRCYETYRIMRGTSKVIPISAMMSSRKRFLKYSAWCWGIPLIISATTVIMQTLQPGTVKSFHPQFGYGKCWFRELNLAAIIYYYGYQLVLHIANVMLLGMSFYLLIKSGAVKCCSIPKKGEVQIRAHNKNGLTMFWQQFFIFLLFVLISFLETVSLQNSRATVWYYLDVINSLQGFYLFMIVWLSNKNRKKIMASAYEATSSFTKTLSTSVHSSVTRMQDFIPISSSKK